VTKGQITKAGVAAALALTYQVAMPLGVTFSLSLGQVDFNLYSSSCSFPSVKDFPWLLLPVSRNPSSSPYVDSVALECSIAASVYAYNYWLNDSRSPFYHNPSKNPLANGGPPDLTLAAGTYTATLDISGPYFTTKTVAVSLVVS
jgi:hypothetical protein